MARGKDNAREERIVMEAIVDAYDALRGHEQGIASGPASRILIPSFGASWGLTRIVRKNLVKVASPVQHADNFRDIIPHSIENDVWIPND
jgi:hypothetical protein